MVYNDNGDKIILTMFDKKDLLLTQQEGKKKIIIINKYMLRCKL